MLFLELVHFLINKFADFFKVVHLGYLILIVKSKGSYYLTILVILLLIGSFEVSVLKPELIQVCISVNALDKLHGLFEVFKLLFVFVGKRILNLFGMLFVHFNLVWKGLSAKWTFLGVLGFV